MNSPAKKLPNTPPRTAKLQRNLRPLLRTALIIAIYLISFIILDFITKQFEGLPGIVTWYPPAGLTYTLLLAFGARFSPAVTIALFISSLVIYRMPQPPYLLLLWAFITTIIYCIAAVFLRKRIHFDWQLPKLRDVTWFVFTTVLVSALLAILSVSSSALSSAMPRSEVIGAIFNWWIGETVGVLTVTPFLLIYVMPTLKRFAEGQPIRLPTRWPFPRPTLSAIGQAASIVLTLYWVFGAHVLDEYHPLYLITLPLIWIALQRGFKGVSAAILALNFGVVLAIWIFRFDLARLGELELLMILNCIVGLLMGGVVTDRKQAEEALRESESRLMEAQTLGRIGNWEFDCVNQSIKWSAEVFRLYERDPATGPPSVEEEAGYYSPEQAKILREYSRCAIEQGRTFEYDSDAQLPSGRIAHFTATMRPIQDETGCIVRLFGTVQDITERKVAEEEIRQLNADLEQRVEARTRQLREAQEQLVRQERLATLGQLAGSVSHELRNPLGVIRNAAYYLRLVQPDADDNIKLYHSLIEDETRTAEKIITDLLDFSRIPSLEREFIAVSELVKRVLKHYPAPSSVQVVLKIPTTLPEVWADPQHVVQVLGNLSVNACQAMPGGGKLTISAAVQGEMMRIDVQDSGTGISPENMGKLFEPLFTTKAKGIGLGLAVSQKLAEANNGKIEVQSELGEGSRFILSLPMYKECMR
jgi:signal transduction histidine kinase/integral membrane sensor domain MASE1